ncbi:MAG: hypothetical protein K8T10_07535 [Candidatus Eremiobacteraeota bacterium]|nr:hypothetical protein [Candidatus Eremiobacteraeota bacterium]
MTGFKYEKIKIVLFTSLFLILLINFSFADVKLEITRDETDSENKTGEVVLHLKEKKIALDTVNYDPDDPGPYRNILRERDINGDGTPDYIISIYPPAYKHVLDMERDYPHYKYSLYIVDGKSGKIMFKSKECKKDPGYDEQRKIHDVACGFLLSEEDNVIIIEYFGPTDVRDELYYFKVNNYYSLDKKKNEFSFKKSKKINEKRLIEKIDKKSIEKSEEKSK